MLQKHWTPVFTGVTTFDEVVKIAPAEKPDISFARDNPIQKS
jgi:hypothetical protein